MTRLKAYLFDNCARIWKGTFCFLLFMRIFYYEWASWLPAWWAFVVAFVIIPIVVLSCLLYVFSTVCLLCKTKRVRALLCSLLLLLPWTTAYETARFYVLRPWMETVAVEVAKDNQNRSLENSGVLAVKLPLKARLLSRQGEVYFAPDFSGIKISFVKSGGGLFIPSEEYVYETHIPYRGNPASIESYPLPEYVRHVKTMCEDWSAVTVASALEIWTA